MQEIGKRIGLIRLLLADIQSKEAQLKEMEGQYRAQLARIVDFVVYRDGDVANALSLMSEVQGKLDEVVQTERHLKVIEEKANSELEVLVLTKRVSEAHSQLAELEKRQRELSNRLNGLDNAGGEQAALPDWEREQVTDIRSINEEVGEVEAEIQRLHVLITETSERAAHTIKSAAGHAADLPRKRDPE